MGVFDAVFGRRGVPGFSSPVLGVNSGVGSFKFLMIAACRGVTGFICPSPVLWTGLACVPTGVPGAGPGRCECRWAAARPRAVRAASFARRVGSLSGQALPPPTGTAAGPFGALDTDSAWCAGAFSRPAPASA